MSDHPQDVGTVLSIGDFSRATNLSVKALRHYHDLGLLEPVQVDRFTGYRSYDTGQVSTAQVIRRLRALQMPLDQIRSVLTAPDLETRNREIAAHLTRMERQLEETQASVVALRDLLEGVPAAPAVTFRRIPATMALGIEEMVDEPEVFAWGVEAFTEIEAVRAALGLTPAGAPGALFPGDFFELERSGITAFVPFSQPDSTPLPEGRVRWHQIPAVEVAVAVHDGPLTEIDRAYGALGTAVTERAIGVDGPLREYFVVGPAEGGEAGRRTEVCWPVFLTGAEDLS